MPAQPGEPSNRAPAGQLGSAVGSLTRDEGHGGQDGCEHDRCCLHPAKLPASGLLPGDCERPSSCLGTAPAGPGGPAEKSQRYVSNVMAGNPGQAWLSSAACAVLGAHRRPLGAHQHHLSGRQGILACLTRRWGTAGGRVQAAGGGPVRVDVTRSPGLAIDRLKFVAGVVWGSRSQQEEGRPVRPSLLPACSHVP